MLKQFWLYGRGKQFELREKVGGESCKVSISRGLPDKSEKLSVLARALACFSKKIWDPIQVTFGPPPDLNNNRNVRELYGSEIREAETILKR